MQYQQRLKNLQALLKELACDAFIVDDPINLYYLTGIELSSGQLLVHTQGAHLFVDNRYFEMCEKKSPFPVILNNKYPLAEKLTHQEFSFIKTLGFNSENTTYHSFLELENFIQKIRQASHGKRKLTLVPTQNAVKVLRTIKDNDEIQLLREAGILGSLGFDHVCTLIKEGITENEIAIELEIFWKRKGSKKLAFDPIIAFGPNSSMPHYRAGSAKLEANQAILVDIGVNFKHYHSDMTRMIFFGQPLQEIQIIHPIVQHAQRTALEMCKPGVLIGDLDNAVRAFISSHGYGDNFTHNLGHGVGLEIHELPTMRNQPFNSTHLQPGMVITIEPGIYLPNIGGVRIEDTILITESGYENLTNRSTDPVMITQ